MMMESMMLKFLRIMVVLIRIILMMMIMIVSRPLKAKEAH